MLKVKDTGTGLDDKQQKQIFKEFARLGNAVTQPGFGLGLSIVKNLVSLMKGKSMCPVTKDWEVFLPLVFLWLQPKSRMWDQSSIERNDKIRLLSLPLMIAMCN